MRISLIVVLVLSGALFTVSYANRPSPYDGDWRMRGWNPSPPLHRIVIRRAWFDLNVHVWTAGEPVDILRVQSQPGALRLEFSEGVYELPRPETPDTIEGTYTLRYENRQGKCVAHRKLKLTRHAASE